MGRKLQVIGKFNQNSVLYTKQMLTDEQKEQARKNIGIDDLPTGGSSGLPEITADDNGKVIQVVDGAYQLVTPEASSTATYNGEVEVV